MCNIHKKNDLDERKLFCKCKHCMRKEIKLFESLYTKSVEAAYYGEA